MKKFFVSVGLAAAGTAGLHASITDPTTKDWTVAGTVRGFYDDNYLTSAQKRSSIGFELSPSIELNMPFQQTELGVKYSYGLYYYQDRQDRGQDPIDQSHQFDLWLDHAINPRWDLTFSDTARVSQEPSLTSTGSATAQRVSGNNLANTANLSVHTDWTRLFSTMLSYQNTFVRYENRQAGGTVTNPVPSFAGLLDRIEQTINPEAQWKVAPATVVMAGYKFGIVNFTADEEVAFVTNAPAHAVKSNSRDNYSHYFYGGVQHSFLENLSGNAQAGLQYTKYYNDPSAQTSVGPYATASLVYTYAPGSYAQIGLSEQRNATDTVQVDSSGHITQDQESFVLYGSITQPLTPKLTGSAVVHYQNSTYHDGAFNDQTSDFYNLGLNVSYAFTRHFSTEVGYNFDYYTSPAGGSYTRNRLYLGLTASY